MNPQMTRAPHPARANRLPSLVLAAALGLLAAGCATESHDTSAEAGMATPLDRFPLTAHEAPDETLLAVHPEGVSPAQQAALALVAVRWRDGGGRTFIKLRMPPGAPYLMADRVRSVLIGQGVPANAVKMEGYQPTGPAPAPMVVAFIRYEADVPVCGAAWENLSATGENASQSNFGCAISANMAAQIANPADIVAPPPMTPSDAGRRSTVMTAYRAGDVTGAKVDSSQSGVISQVIK